MKFLMGEVVVVRATGVKGTVHHTMQFPGQPWKAVVDLPGGDQGTFTEEELDHASDA
jgi:hypothetical protein